MRRTCRVAPTDSILDAQRSVPEATGADAIAVAARDVAETLDLKAIVAWTCSGSTAFRIARERPGPPILALTPNPAAARRLNMLWGVHPIITKDAHDINDMALRACKFAGREGLATTGDRIVIVAGVPFGTPARRTTCASRILTRRRGWRRRRGGVGKSKGGEGGVGSRETV